MTVFFAKLNSDKYGCILDLLLQVRKGINQLKKQHVALPPEISGLFILIQKMTQFVIDNHIDPIMKPGSRRMIKAGEAELCDYEGSPFMDKNEEKELAGPVVLRRVANTGMCLNLLSGSPKIVRAFSLAAAGFVSLLYTLALFRKKGAWKKAALSMMTAGAWSNTFDRFALLSALSFTDGGKE